mmetsp:Transcript_2313/g.2660  ORF Transcript_2313/g.2660 Transcript_2313/m.2660 type:complete len:94 (-) Transcript_2313:73-354(-)
MRLAELSSPPQRSLAAMLACHWLLQVGPFDLLLNHPPNTLRALLFMSNFRPSSSAALSFLSIVSGPKGGFAGEELDPFKAAVSYMLCCQHGRG